jgi:hypothetical protein
MEEPTELIRLALKPLSILQPFHDLPFRSPPGFLSSLFSLRHIVLFRGTVGAQTVRLHASVRIASSHSTVANFDFDLAQLGTLLVAAGHNPATFAALVKSNNTNYVPSTSRAETHEAALYVPYLITRPAQLRTYTVIKTQ